MRLKQIRIRHNHCEASRDGIRAAGRSPRSRRRNPRKPPARRRFIGDVMKVKSGVRQSMLSLIVFVIVLAGLVLVDVRVRDRFSNLLSGGDQLSPLGDRAADLGSALVSAVRHQSVENAPVLVFTTVGVVLFLFMVRS